MKLIHWDGYKLKQLYVKFKRISLALKTKINKTNMEVTSLTVFGDHAIHLWLHWDHHRHHSQVTVYASLTIPVHLHIFALPLLSPIVIRKEEKKMACLRNNLIFFFLLLSDYILMLEFKIHTNPSSKLKKKTKPRTSFPNLKFQLFSVSSPSQNKPNHPFIPLNIFKGLCCSYFPFRAKLKKCCLDSLNRKYSHIWVRK